MTNQELIRQLKAFIDCTTVEFNTDEWGNVIACPTLLEAKTLLSKCLAALEQSTWQPIETAPKNRVKFWALMDDLPYIAMYDEDERFLWLNHSNIATGASYKIHNINGKRLLEETKKEEYNYQKQWNIWKLGFEHTPTHWMPLPLPPKAQEGR